ncbi:hypothetical protein RF11_09243 [Thelohanellus kitauei]|uniref:Sortilin C-terminal domain-containing protein n=1 Tax=Thelohanellus kitauei TaxID=669202 RepID=A0A0C2JPD8_THEKT|nr:hypothetical protein RF11_09243 [Thelohanellus kitauei]
MSKLMMDIKRRVLFSNKWISSIFATDTPIYLLTIRNPIFTPRFLDIDDNDDSIKFTKPAVLDFIKYKNYILFIESSESTNNLDLSVYDVHKNQPIKLVFPELLEIKDVKMFKVLGHDFYFVLVHNDKITCLWVSTETRYKLGRTICTNIASESIDESNFYFDKKLRNQIFLNFPNQEKKHQTLRSTNKGRIWYEMKFINPNDSPYSLPVHFQFSQYDRRDVMDNLKEIDIQYTESKNGRIPFISYDDGNLWIATPITNSRLVMLKDGMVLVSAHTDTNEINYNVDKGKNTWFRSKLFENQPRVLYIGRLPGEVSTALLITKDVGKNKLIFSSIHFSKILKGECKTRQYESWRFFASGEYCESYRIFDMSTPKPENYCIDTKSHIIGNDVCECTADFYGWYISELINSTYGYRPWGDACFPDSLMRQIKKPDVCSRETGQKQHELGFINMDESRCKPDKAYGVTPMITTQFCAISG